MPASLTVSPNKTAAEKFGRRSATLGARALSTAQWAQMPLELRERAFFSAGVGNAKILSAMRDKIGEHLNMVRSSGAYVDRESFIADMKAFLESQGCKLGGGNLTDITSRQRLKLIFDMNVEEAREYSRYVRDQNVTRLNMFPAFELERKEQRVNKRDWLARWKAAGGKFYGGRMIALKTDPIWLKISRFGRPWAPFDFNSGMGQTDIPRSECVKLGLIGEKERLTPKPVDFNQGASLPSGNIDGDILKEGQLKGVFGKEENGEVSIRPNAKPVSDALDLKIGDKTLKREVNEAIAAINTVHGDGTLPKIPVQTGRMKNAYGQLTRRMYSSGRVEAEISLIKNNSHKRMTAAHEIGHFLDAFGASESNGITFASENGEMPEFVEAVRKSKRFQDIKDNPYMASSCECFARAYAQFVAEESKDPGMLKELEIMRLTEPTKVWDADDFKNIKAAIKAAFKKRGWL